MPSNAHYKPNTLVDISAATWLVVGLALLCANLPFVSQRLFLLIPFASGRKSGWLRVLELFFYYGVVGVAARFLEASNSAVAVQRWEFYAITASIFLVFAFPGFVYCYLLKRRS